MRFRPASPLPFPSKQILPTASCSAFSSSSSIRLLFGACALVASSSPSQSATPKFSVFFFNLPPFLPKAVPLLAFSSSIS
eukprot:17575_6